MVLLYISMNLVSHDLNSHKFLMAQNHKRFHSLGIQTQIRVETDHPQKEAIFPTPPSSAFPILAVALLSIMGTAFLLASYYIFVVKCCSINWHQLNPLRRLSVLGSRQDDDSFIALSPTAWNRGLDESAIRDIPSFQFKGGEMEERSVFGCVVCLCEFQVHETLRVLPNCNHAFHLDCIDIWLQTNANCPLCRKSITGAVSCPLDRIVAPSSSPRDFQAYPDSLMGSDEDFVVIELGGEEEVMLRQGDRQERSSATEFLAFPGEMEKRVKKCHHVSIMGDEGIDVRDHGKDDQFCVQPIRRSFSWDSATDRQLYSTVHEIMFRKSTRGVSEVSTSTQEPDGRVRRSFFPFRNGRGSRNAVVPFEM